MVKKKCSLDPWLLERERLEGVNRGDRYSVAQAPPRRPEKYKWADNWNKQNMKPIPNPEISFFFLLWGHNFGLHAQSLKWIAWREWLWCDNHSQVNLSSLTCAQGIHCAISRKTKKCYWKECFLNNVPALIRWLIGAHLKARL